MGRAARIKSHRRGIRYMDSERLVAVARQVPLAVRQPGGPALDARRALATAAVRLSRALRHEPKTASWYRRELEGRSMPAIVYDDGIRPGKYRNRVVRVGTIVYDND